MQRKYRAWIACRRRRRRLLEPNIRRMIVILLCTIVFDCDTSALPDLCGEDCLRVVTSFDQNRVACVNISALCKFTDVVLQQLLDDDNETCNRFP